MKKFMLISLLGLSLVARAGAPQALKDVMCPALKGALVGLKVNDESKKLRNNIAKLAGFESSGVSLFPIMCEGLLDAMYNSAPGTGKEKAQNFMLLAKCPGYICTNIIPEIMNGIDSLPFDKIGLGAAKSTVVNILKQFLQPLQSAIGSIYKAQPMMLTACAFGVGKALNNAKIKIGGGEKPYWTPPTGNILVDSMACVPDEVKYKFIPKPKPEEKTETISEEDLGDLF